MKGLTGRQNAGDVSDTTSVMSSIFRYREQHGRTYHAYRDDSGQGNQGFKRTAPGPGTFESD